MSSDLAACYQSVQYVLKNGLVLAKSELGGGGWAYSRHAVHIVAALAGCECLWSTLAEPFLTLLSLYV